MSRKSSSDNLPTIIIDTREQKPYLFRANANLAGAVRQKLDYGDYSVAGIEHIICIERKQDVDELCNNLGRNRARFIRELERMQASKLRYIVVEDYWSSVFRPKRSKMNPKSIFESIMAFSTKYGVHFIFAGNRKMAQRIVRGLLLKAYKYREEMDVCPTDSESLQTGVRVDAEPSTEESAKKSTTRRTRRRKGS